MSSDEPVPRPPEGVALSSHLDDPDALPYFLWDEPMSVADLHHRLTTTSRPERNRLLAKVLREARDTEVWKFTTPQAVADAWGELAPRLGRRRAFWEFILRRWHEEGRISLDRSR